MLLGSSSPCNRAIPQNSTSRQTLFAAVGALSTVVPETGRSFRAGMWVATRDARHRRPSTTTLQRRKKLLPFGQLLCYVETFTSSWHVQSQKIESNNGLLQPALSCARPVIGASPASPVLGRENEGGKPEIGHQQVERQKVSAVFPYKWQYHRNGKHSECDSRLRVSRQHVQMI